MEEDKLKVIWQNGDKEAAKYFDDVSTELVQKAKHKSNDVLQRVRKNMIWEFLVSIALSVLFIWYFQNSELLLYVIVFVISGVGFSLKVNMNYLRKISRVNDENVLVAMTNRKEILAKYYKRIRRMTYILTPIGFLFGISLSILENGDDLTKSLILGLFVSPFLFLLIRFSLRVVDSLYGMPLTHLTSIHNELVSEWGSVG